MATILGSKPTELSDELLAELDLKADLDTVTDALELKADKQATADAIEVLATKTELSDGLNSKVNTQDLESALSSKADTEYVDIQLGTKLTSTDIDAILKPINDEIITINTAIGDKAPSNNPTFTGNTHLPDTANVFYNNVSLSNILASNVPDLSAIETSVADNATAITSKANANNPTFTGNVTLPALSNVITVLDEDASPSLQTLLDAKTDNAAVAGIVAAQVGASVGALGVVGLALATKVDWLVYTFDNIARGLTITGINNGLANRPTFDYVNSNLATITYVDSGISDAYANLVSYDFANSNLATIAYVDSGISDAYSNLVSYDFANSNLATIAYVDSGISDAYSNLAPQSNPVFSGLVDITENSRMAGKIEVLNNNIIDFSSVNSTDYRQKINLHGSSYGIGVEPQELYFRSSGAFAWYKGGTHLGGSVSINEITTMDLDGLGNLTIKGSFDAQENATINNDLTVYGAVSLPSETNVFFNDVSLSDILESMVDTANPTFTGTVNLPVTSDVFFNNVSLSDILVSNLPDLTTITNNIASNTSAIGTNALSIGTLSTAVSSKAPTNNPTFTGAVKIDNMLFRTFERSLNTTANSTTQICNIASTHGAFSGRLVVCESEAYRSNTRVYDFAVSHLESILPSQGGWKELLSITSTGRFGNNDFTVDILNDNTNSNNARLRLRRVSGNSGGIGYTCSLTICTSSRTPVTITSLDTQSTTEPAITGFYNSTMITQIDGKVGIKNPNPTKTLEVNGTMSVNDTVHLPSTSNVLFNEVPLSTIINDISTISGTPLGGIIMWSGTISNIPSGWALCDGSTNLLSDVIIPDLRDKFIIGAGGAGFKSPQDEGGSADAIIPEHNHTGSTDLSGAHTHTGNTSDAGGHRHKYTSWVEKISTDFNAFELQQHGLGFDGDRRRKENPTSLTSENGSHGHGLNINSNIDHTHTVTINNTGVSGINANLPPYYALAYIVRVLSNAGETFTENTPDEFLTAVSSLSTAVSEITNMRKDTITASAGGVLTITFSPAENDAFYQVVAMANNGISPTDLGAYQVMIGAVIKNTTQFRLACRARTGDDINFSTTDMYFDIVMLRAGKIIESFTWRRQGTPNIVRT